MFRCIARPLGLWIVLGTVIASAGWAGDGEIADGKVNLSIMFTYRETDADAWKPVFEEASRLLYNATNGQLQLGEVHVLNCSFDKDGADVWVLSGNHGAFANVLALGGLGHIYISQTHESTTPPALGQFGVVHEFGHYGFGLYDEYKGGAIPAALALAGGGPGGSPGGGLVGDRGEQTMATLVPNQFCVTDLDPVACLMDGGTTVAPNNARTEYCTHVAGGLSTAHNEGTQFGDSIFINAQQLYNGESCWETIFRTVGLEPPSDVDTADPAGLEPIDWVVAPPYNRVMIVLDRSQSMYGPQEEIALAKEAARVFVSYLHEKKTITIDDGEGEEVTLPGEHLGIVSFANIATLDLPMTEILDPSTKASAQAIIDGITTPYVEPQSTDMGAGLQSALNEIVGQGERACSESIVLLSDGGHNIGTDPHSVLPALEERGVRIYAVGLGSDAEEELLEEVADSTDGKYYRILSEDGLAEVMTEIAAEVRAAGTIGAFADSIFGADESIATFVHALSEEVTALLEYQPNGTLNLTLTSPTGEVITVDSAADREDVEAGVENGFVYLRVADPDEGIWVATVHVIEQDGPTGFNLTFLEESSSVLLQATTDQQTYQFPEPVYLRADVIADVPVAGIPVTAVVDRPGAGPVMLQLYDDGDPSHHDQWADDGVYNAIFSAFTLDGEYTFHVTADNSDGSGVPPDPDLPFVEDGGAPPGVIPPFLRETDVSVQVEGLVPPIDASVTFSPTTVSTASANGRFTVYIELPEPYSADQIDQSTIRLNDVLAPDDHPMQIGDQDGDGIPDLMVKFRRGDILDTLPEGFEVEVRISGNLDSGEFFEGSGTIVVLDPQTDPAVTVSPDPVPEYGTLHVGWIEIDARPVTYSGYLTLDGGSTWQRIFDGVQAQTSLDWQVTAPATTGAQILVQASTPEGVVDQRLSPGFDIETASGAAEPPAGVTSFRGVFPNPTKGSAVLWYSLAERMDVALDIYDVSGRIVRRLASGSEPAGLRSVTWDGSDAQGQRVSSGVYLYVFEAGSYKQTGRLMLIR